MNEDVIKKPKNTKSKLRRPILLLHDSDDNVPIQTSLNNLVVMRPSFLESKHIVHCFKVRKKIHISYLQYVSQI